MAFIVETEQLKFGLIIFRRDDVTHGNFDCRIKLPKEDRYKTISLHTADRESARDRRFDQDADIRFRVKHDVAVFNRPFRQVAEEYLQMQQRRADTGAVEAVEGAFGGDVDFPACEALRPHDYRTGALQPCGMHRHQENPPRRQS